jgi:hypothetical protein
MTNFLSPTEQTIIDSFFAYKVKKMWRENDMGRYNQTQKKCVIPIGVQDLVFKDAEWTGTKKTGELMLKIKIWKPPIIADGKKRSFDYMYLYHLIANKAHFKLNERWFYQIGRFYTEEQLNALKRKKGGKFKALIKHVENVYNGNLFVKPEIIKVYDKDEEIDLKSINYLKLYERMRT